METYLPKQELKDGSYYEGHCRNATVALWDAKGGVFWYMRTKFRLRFSESINHPENDDGHDLFYPVKEVIPKEQEMVLLE
jgi:hypothetical protein